MAVVMYERRSLLIGSSCLAPRGQPPMNMSAPHLPGPLVDGFVSARRRALAAGPSSEPDACARTRSEHSVRPRGFLSGREPLERPAVALAPVAQAVVQAVVAVLPELVRVGTDAEPAPFVRQRRVVAVT